MNTISKSIFSWLIFGIFIFSVENQKSNKINKAISYINGNKETKSISGIVVINENEKSVSISGSIEGLKPDSIHGFHIHQFGDIGNYCMNTGLHYNPFNKKHGGPDDKDRHFGDLGNFQANQHGKIIFNTIDHVIRLSGEFSAVGRSFVLHAKRDNYSAQPVGDAGARIACGVIGIHEG